MRLPGGEVMISAGGGGAVDDASVVKADGPAKNDVIRVIDTALMPKAGAGH